MDDNEKLQSEYDALKRRSDELHELAVKVEQQKIRIRMMTEDMREEKKQLEEYQTQLANLALRSLKDEDFGKNKDAENGLEDESWRDLPVTDLPGLSTKQIELLAANFANVGSVCDWIGDDWQEKISGIGPALKEKIRDAIDQISGVTNEDIRKIAEDARSRVQ